MMAAGLTILDPAKVLGLRSTSSPAQSPPASTRIRRTLDCRVGQAPAVTGTRVFDFEKIQKAIADKNFEGEVRGVPVLKHDAVIEGEVPVGLGPLPTQYDGKGNAYTSMYVESAVAKWSLPAWTDAQRRT